MVADKAVSGLRKALVALAAAASATTSTTNGANARTPSSEVASRMRIAIGSKVFTATLSDTATAKAFKAMLPLAVKMNDLNANEKYVDLADALPRQASSPGTIHTGDLMLYGTNTLVLFYKTFSTSYSYTRIGKVDDVTGLAAVLGSGNVTVRFAL